MGLDKVADIPIFTVDPPLLQIRDMPAVHAAPPVVNDRTLAATAELWRRKHCTWQRRLRNCLAKINDQAANMTGSLLHHRRAMLSNSFKTTWRFPRV